MEESTHSGGVGRTVAAGDPLIRPRPPSLRNVTVVEYSIEHLLASTIAYVFYVSMYSCIDLCFVYAT